MHELKTQRYIYLTKEDPTTFWGSLKTRLKDQARVSRNRGDYYQTFLHPACASWSNAGWSSFERNISEHESYAYSKETGWSSGVSAGWGLWSVGGGASGSSKFTHSDSSVSSVSLKFEYLRVKIFRPWIVEDVFGYRFWTWDAQFGGDLISNGGNLAINPPVRPIGRMPVLPEYFIVVRNVELSAAFSQEELTTYERETKAKASIGWGPFSVSGSYSEKEGSQYVKGSYDNMTFRINQPQIIARTGLMLPKSPNPDRALPWQKDAWFPDDHSATRDRERTVYAKDYANALREEWLMEAQANVDSTAALLMRQQRTEIESRVREATHSGRGAEGSHTNGGASQPALASARTGEETG